LSHSNYITASCIICENIIYKNDALVFENKVASFTEFLLSAYRRFEINYPKFHKMDGLSKLGWLSAEILLKDSLPAGKYDPEETGIVLANASSSLDTDIKYYDTVKEIPSPALFVYTLPNIVIGEISIRHNFKGENAFFIFDEFNTGFMEKYVSNLINNNILQACICGWVELLDEQYQSVLFLVEKNNGGRHIPFTKEEIQKIYDSENG
jgi:hypothetical protein